MIKNGVGTLFCRMAGRSKGANSKKKMILCKGSTTLGSSCGMVGRATKMRFQHKDVRSLNAVIGKFYSEHLFDVNCIEKTKIKKKSLGTAHFKFSTTIEHYAQFTR